MITDDGLAIISQLPNLKNLMISGLQITGAGLASFEHLIQLCCSESTVFDKGMCQMLRRCQKLRFINAQNCKNLTAMVIETANQIISERQSNLRIIIDANVMQQKKSKLSAYLEVVSGDYVEETYQNSDNYYLHQRVSGGSYLGQINIERIISIQIQDNPVPILNGDCLMHILEFIPLSQRIPMERGMFFSHLVDLMLIVSDPFPSIQLLENLDTKDDEQSEKFGFIFTGMGVDYIWQDQRGNHYDSHSHIDENQPMVEKN